MKNIHKFVDMLMEKSTPDKPIWNKEAILENHEPKWNYIDGCMAKAILDMYLSTNDKKYLDFVDSFIDFYIHEDGTIRGYHIEDVNCDNINEGKVLFDLYKFTKKEKYKKALDLLRSQLDLQPRTTSGNFWHKKIYPNQIWLDGLYMVQPFYMRYEKEFNTYAGYRDIFNQFMNVVELMKDQETGLLYHGYDETKEMFWADSTSGCSKNFWTRSLGWYAMALVDTIEVIDDQYFYEYETLQQHLKSILDALLKYQDQTTKLFYQVTTAKNKPGNYLETSGSCAIAYALMKGARLGYLPTYYANIGQEILSQVVELKLVEDDDGFNLKDICLVAGLGGMPGKGNYELRDGTFEYYVSEPIVDNDAKGVAPLIFAYCEYIRKQGCNT